MDRLQFQADYEKSGIGDLGTCEGGLGDLGSSVEDPKERG